MRTLEELFKVAKELKEINKLHFSYTTYLAFMYLAGKLIDKETEIVEKYLSKRDVNMETVYQILSYNNIKFI